MMINAGCTTLAAIAAVPLLCGCSVDVRRDTDGLTTDVAVRSPLGNVTVESDPDTPPDTGLTVHPGARPSSDRHTSNANVSLDSATFGVTIAAATFEDDEPPRALVDFYRQDLARYGAVTECRGDVQFPKRGNGSPFCRPKASESQTQLVVGSESDHRIAAIRPQGSGSKFALLHIQTDLENAAD